MYLDYRFFIMIQRLLSLLFLFITLRHFTIIAVHSIIYLDHLLLIIIKLHSNLLFLFIIHFHLRINVIRLFI